MERRLVAVAVVCAVPFAVLQAQEVAARAVYTASQAEAGRAAYQSSCATCHTDSLIPAASAQYMGQAIPPLAGNAFMARWGEQKTDALSMRIKTAMGGFPPKNSDEKTHLNLAAYILQVNGARPGNRELTRATAEVVRTVTNTP